MVLLCLVPARAQAETSTLGVTARVGYGVLETALRNSLNQGKALTSTYQGTAANGHATVRAGYRADLPNLTLSRTGPTELRLAVPVTVTRIERDRTFLNLDKVASLGYQVNGCTTLVVTARAAVTLQPDRGILRLLESPSPPSGQVKSGTCSVTKKPAADIAKLLGGFAGGVVDLFGTVTGNKKLSEQGKALKRQLNALPNRVVVQDLVRDAVDEAVRDAVDRALTSGQDRVLERLFLAKLSEGLERTLSAAGNVVSLGLRPLRTTIDAVAAMPAGLVIEASSELVSSFALAGSVAG